MKIKVLSVTEVNNYIKKLLENDYIIRNLSVKGEISNLKYHSSGHIYFSLKDETAKINCIMFRNKAMLMDLKLKEGMKVTVLGKASMYTKDGTFQLYCEEIQQDGIGELYIRFEKLKEKLSLKGYFSEEYKKDIPKYPKRVGIITSETGAAIRDIINVARRRNKKVDLVLYPAQVQGENAYKTVIEGIEYFNKSKSVDVIILGRGGGSIEELWNFNEEELALAIFNSNIPTISAVGHEVDYTISDFVADYRAATPSQGAEIAIPLEEALTNDLKDIFNKLNRHIEIKIKDEKNNLDHINKILNFNSPLSKIVNDYKEIDKLNNLLNIKIRNRLEMEKNRVEMLNKMLIAYNPLLLLNKGYAIIEDENRKNIKSVNELREEKVIKITLSDGEVKGVFKENE